ncbi:hypothetical protein C8R47DRAFT_1087121 [Mycena vitilis]|nr:hypothetical protein C8R47DRAFT_1087121 [Mycena vitilis]
MFSVQSSPGYFVNELPGPEGLETARPHSGFGRHPRTPHYPNHYGHYSQTDNSFTDSLVLPRPASYHELSIVQRPPSHWGYPQSALPGALPSISQNSRHTSARPPSPPDAHVMNEFNATQFPVAEDVRRWPQMFKINQVKKGGAKKQMMACLFCRERKIGCTRPAEHEPDQTCNQCARRKRECVYPTESRRGQHTRNRLSSKKFLGLDELKLPLVTPPKLPGTE